MIKKHDFIEIEYTGNTKDENIVFDTTDEKTAKGQGFLQENAAYGPVVICVGENQVIAGLDKHLEDKEIGKEYTFTLQPEEAFGKKSAKLVQLIPLNKFKQNNIMPQPGLQVNIDNTMGIIKTVSGGRVLVDFNHPLSGKVVEYKVKILRNVEDDKEKLSSYMKITTGLKELKTELNDGKAVIEFPADIDKEMTIELSSRIKELIPSIKEIEFRKAEKEPTKK